jgi:NodT family efflux transporter outer membrane factor (OMF) lipoprotein
MIRLLLFLLILTACNPLQHQKLSEPKIPASYSVETETKEVTIRGKWWLEFNDPSLNQLQAGLFSDNLDLAQALHRLEQLQASQTLAGASRWPNLSLNGSVARDNSPSAAGTNSSTSSRISVAAGYELDLWNKLKDKHAAAILRTKAGEHDIQALLLSLSAQLTEQYFLAVEQGQQLLLLDRQINRNEALLATVTDRYRVGLATAGELYQAQQGLVALRTRRPQIVTTLAQAQNMIAVMLGQAPGSQTIESKKLPPISDVTTIGLPADLLSRRPDVASKFLALEAADHELAAALADRLPAINLSATLGRSITRLASGDIEGTFWNIALGLSQPLIDGGRRKAESARQLALRDEKFAAYRKIILQSMEEVESALIAETNSAERARLLDQQLQINLNDLQLTQDNYRSGLLSSDVLLNREISHLDVRSQILSQQRQWLSQRITLARALGGRWMATELEQQQKSKIGQQDQAND